MRDKLYSYIENFKMVCLIIFACVVPLIVKAKEILINPDAHQHLTNEILYVDVFSYYKSTTIVVLGILLILMHILQFLVYKPHSIQNELKNPFFICTIIYLFFVFCSGIHSAYPFTVIQGYTERYESIFVIFSYMIFFLYAKSFIKKPKDIQIILYGILFSATIISIIGFLQHNGNNPLLSELGKKIIFHSIQYSSITANSNSVSATLYNPNCVGMYFSMLFPLTFILGMTLPFRNLFKYINIMLSILMYFMILYCRAAGGFTGAIASIFIVYIICIIRYIYTRTYKKLVLHGIIFIFALSGLSVYAINLYHQKGNNYIKDIFYADKSRKPYFNSIDIIKNMIIINTYNAEIKILNENHLPIVYINDKEIIAEIKDNHHIFKDDSIGTVDIQVANNIFIVNHGSKLYFSILEDETFTALDRKLNPVIWENNLPTFIDKYGYYASSRGYIWYKSFMLLKDNFIFGQGSDTFAFAFPQNDIGKLRFLQNMYMLVDKPHMSYIQIGVNTGVISLVSILILFIIYLIESIRTIIKSEKSNTFIFSTIIALLGANLGYMISGLTTDSVVSVAPVFWTLLGIGIGTNRLQKPQKRI